MMTVLIFKECGKYVAQAIERDICVQADDRRELLHRFAAIVDAEKSSRGGSLETIDPAPDRFWERAMHPKKGDEVWDWVA